MSLLAELTRRKVFKVAAPQRDLSSGCTAPARGAVAAGEGLREGLNKYQNRRYPELP